MKIEITIKEDEKREAEDLQLAINALRKIANAKRQVRADSTIAYVLGESRQLIRDMQAQAAAALALLEARKDDKAKSVQVHTMSDEN